MPDKKENPNINTTKKVVGIFVDNLIPVFLEIRFFKGGLHSSACPYIQFDDGDERPYVKGAHNRC
jgi:hypothetical protein